MNSGPRDNVSTLWKVGSAGSFSLIFIILVFSLAAAPLWAAPETLLVSAEGLADPNAETYQRDKGLLLDALREDARRQVVEKAVGTFVESATLVENYELIHDRVLTQSKGLIKRVVKESDPWLGEDGFMHLLLKAEVYLTNVREAIQTMSRAERLNLIKEHGNPRIAVSVAVKDAERGTRVPAERSAVAENILKERISGFGYRVWSTDDPDSVNAGSDDADFFITGEAKFKPLSVKLKASGIKLTKYVLTSWTVKCLATDTGEEIYFNSKVPKAKSWSDEDAALEDIGRLIGEEFTQEFFEVHLMKPSRIFQLSVTNLPDYDTGLLLKRELIGLRPVLNVNLRSFDAKGASVYEVEFSGKKGNFVQIVNDTVVKPLNKKLQSDAFRLLSAKGDVVELEFQVQGDPQEVAKKFNSMPPASLSSAPAGRIKELVHDKDMLRKVSEINPAATGEMVKTTDEPQSKGVSAVEEF